MTSSDSEGQFPFATPPRSVSDYNSKYIPRLSVLSLLVPGAGKTMGHDP